MFDLSINGLAGPFDTKETELVNALSKKFKTTDKLKNIHNSCPLSQRLLSSKEVREKISSFFGQNLVVWRTNSFRKEYGSKEIQWHHDRHFENGDLPLNFSNLKNHFSILIALDDMDEETGIMEFLLGSHKNWRGCQRDTRPFHMKDITEHFIEPPKFLLENNIQITLKKGQFIIFHSGLLHRSLGSKSHKVRHSFVARLCNSSVKIPLKLANNSEIYAYP